MHWTTSRWDGRTDTIKPLIAELDFIIDKTHWGAVFRFGQVKISEADFMRITTAMQCGEMRMPSTQTPQRMQAALF